MLFEVAFCCVLPLTFIPFRTHTPSSQLYILTCLAGYAVASHRYIIIEDFGCSFVFDRSTVAAVLILVPYITLSLMCFIFACEFHRPSVSVMPTYTSSTGMAARNLILRRMTTQDHNTRSTLTTSRFIHLLFVCIVVGVWALLAVLLSQVVLWKSGVPSWRGWDTVHKYFRQIPTIPSRLITPEFYQTYMRYFWYQTISSYLIFGIYICTEDVRDDLRRFWGLLTRRMPSEDHHIGVVASQWFDDSDNRSNRSVLLRLLSGISDVKNHLGRSLRRDESNASTTTGP